MEVTNKYLIVYRDLITDVLVLITKDEKDERDENEEKDEKDKKDEKNEKD